MRFAICTSIYEAARPFFNEWIDSAVAASAGYETQVIISLDGVDKTDPGLEYLSNVLPLAFTRALPEPSISQVRSAMINRAIECDADILVFCDIDDRLEDNAFSLHATALETSDFSYGDMRPITRDGSALEPTFFGDSAVPRLISKAESIIDRNWLGFSNTAIWRTRLPSAGYKIPKGIIAVDWWLFTTFLKNNMTGKQADSVVCKYRIHGANLLGHRPLPTLEGIKKRLNISKKHYEAFPSDILACHRLKRINNLIAEINERPRQMQLAIESACANAVLWYEDIAQLIEISSAADSAAL